MKNIVAFLLLWLGLILQSTMFQIPPINYIQPNFVLVVLMVAALFRGPRAALVLGIIIGFIQDAAFGPFIGLYAFTYGVLAYFASAAFAQFLHKNVAITFLVTVVCTFLQVWLTFGMTRLFNVTAYTWHMVLTRCLWQMIVNGIVLLILYPILAKLMRERVRARYQSSRGSEST